MLYDVYDTALLFYYIFCSNAEGNM